MWLMLILIGVSSCSNEDENIGNVPSQLLKTWYMGEGTSITFNADGTGVYTETSGTTTAKLIRKAGTRATDTYPFTYSYEESTQTLTIHIDGDVMRWTIVTLSDDTLKIKDEDGELITLKKDTTPEPGIDINLLYNTWISEEQDLYTFNNDGSGSYKAKDETSANDITYEYDEASRLLTLHRVDGKVVRWTILSLTNDTMKVEDNDGQELTLTAYVNTAWIELLYGKWGVAGRTLMEFTNREGNKLFTLHEGEEMEPYTVPFKYDAYNRIYFFENENWGDGYWQVKQVTQDILSLEIFGLNGENLTIEGSMTLFRIPEPDELVVGDESLLYGDEWTSFDSDSGAPMTWQFRENFQDLIWKVDGEELVVNYTYDAESHVLTLTSEGEKEVYKITKLTDRFIYLEGIDEEGEPWYMIPQTIKQKIRS